MNNKLTIKKSIVILLSVLLFIFLIRISDNIAQSVSTILKEYNSMEFLNSSNKLTLRGVARDFWLFPDNKTLGYYDGGTNIGIISSAVTSGLVWNATARKIMNKYRPARTITNGPQDANGVCDIYVNVDTNVLSESDWANEIFGKLSLNRANIAKTLAGLRLINIGSQHHTTGLTFEDEKNANGGTTGAKVLSVYKDNEYIILNNQKQLTVDKNKIVGIITDYIYQGYKIYTNDEVVVFDCEDATGEANYIINKIKEYEGFLNGHKITFKFKWKHPILNGNLANITNVIGVNATNLVHDFDLRGKILNFEKYFGGFVIFDFECKTPTNSFSTANSYHIGGNVYLYTGFLRISRINFKHSDYSTVHHIFGNGNFDSPITNNGNVFYYAPTICSPAPDPQTHTLIYNQTIYSSVRDLILINFDYTANVTNICFHNSGLYLELFNVIFGLAAGGVPNTAKIGVFSDLGITLLHQCQTMHNIVNMNLSPTAGLITRTYLTAITKLSVTNKPPWGLVDFNNNSGANAHEASFGGLLIGPNGTKAGF